MEVGADVHAKDYADKDAFMYALTNCNLRSAEVLLAAGLVPAALSTISAPYFPMVDEVLEMLRRNNVTEEDIARLLGSLLPAVVSEDKPDVEIIKQLAEYGADANATNEKGNTALLVAVANGCSGTIIKAILAAGADPRITDSKGQTTVQIAQKSRCATGIITALEKAIAKIEKAEAKAAEKAAKAAEKAAKSAKKKK
jgi:ankyrin repeat protein